MVNRGWGADYLDGLSEQEFLTLLDQQIQMDEAALEAERKAAEREK